MNLEDIACQISDLLETNRSVLLKTEPEVPDHTIRAPFKIIVCGTNHRIELDATAENIASVIAILDITIFDKEKVDRLYAWNLKSLCTYFKAVCPSKFITPATSMLDLKPIEHFLGIRKNPPENLNEAINRIKLAVQKKGWQLIYKAVHLPLSLRILPSIETTPLLNEETKRSEFPYYEIEGQPFGRMNCLNKFSKCYSPHRLGPTERKNLKPRGYGVRFLTADFRHCEVTVLQWLSKDDKLKDLLDSGQDLHEAIYKAITGDDCNTDKKRNISKLIFLPVMYGRGAKNISEKMGLPETVAKELISRIKVTFPTAWDWMYDKQEQARKGPVLDYFGRPRNFAEADCYTARNFSVQAVAATVCQEKLIELHNKLTPDKAYLVYSVYDGYGMVANVSTAKQSYRLVKDALETESKLCAGLQMKVHVKFGAKLDAMKELWKD